MSATEASRFIVAVFDELESLQAAMQMLAAGGVDVSLASILERADRQWPPPWLPHPDRQRLQYHLDKGHRLLVLEIDDEQFETSCGHLVRASAHIVETYTVRHRG
jgi:hypothetical protein